MVKKEYIENLYQLNQQNLEKALSVFKGYSKKPIFEEDTMEREKRKNIFKEILKEKFK